MSNIKKIIKRDGREVEFELEKLVNVIERAGGETQEFRKKEAKRLAEIVTTLLLKADYKKPSVEQIQDTVEQVLMAAGHYQTAKAYILYREKRGQERRVERQLGVKDDLNLSVNQLKVMESRYLLKDEEGKVIETPSELFQRVAENLAKVETKKKRAKVEQEFYGVMSRLEFLPAGRTLNNAGTPQSQLANCFVLPVEDSMEGIFDAVKWMAMVQMRGGGTGFNFSKLRPRGDVVTKSTGGFATGPISFMKVFDIATRQVMQGGKKRGANMGILNIDHPDIMEFITAKQETGEISNFNISVGITDSFMRAVEKDWDWELKNPRDGEVVSTVRARSLFNQLVTLAWRTGDPGLIFLDPINRDNPLLESYGPIDSTNPCGEQPLHPFDACNLGSVNLAVHVRENPKYQVLNSKQIQNNNEQIIKREIDWDKLKQTVRVGVRMLDNVIDVCKYPLPQITKTVRANRRIGLGVMGWADMLFQLRIAYDSREGVKLAEKVAKFIQDTSWEMSEELAKEKGEFPRWSESSFAKATDDKSIAKATDDKSIAKATDDKSGRKVRNVAITTIAPTGSISMLADASSGIEPVFALAYTKNVVEAAGLTYMNKYFERELEVSKWADGDPEHKVRDRIIREVVREGSLAHISGVPEEVKQVYRTAHDISPEWHVKMQAAWQKQTDNAVSKTINFPSTATIEEVEEAYLSAWKAGCKGITVYRDGSIEGQILSVGSASQRVGESAGKQVIQSKIKTETLKQRIVISKQETERARTCPECGTKLVVEEGCSKCYGCGYSVCGG